MAMTDSHYTRASGIGRRLTRRLRAWQIGLGLLAVLLLLTVVSYARASADQAAPAVPLVESVAVNTSENDIEIDVTTDAGEPPFYTFFPLREPDRLVMDLPDFAWQPGLTAHLPSSHPAIDSIRVGQFSDAPPVTRVVLDLTVPAQDLRYRTLEKSAAGSLRVRIVDAKQAGAEPGWSVPEPAEKPLPDPRAGAEAPAETPSPAAPVTAPVVTEPPAPAVPEPQPEVEPATQEPVAEEPVPEAEPAAQPVVEATPAQEPELVRQRVAAETPPPVRQDAGGMGRGHLIGLIAGLAIICGAAILALLLRRRSRAAAEEVTGAGTLPPTSKTPPASEAPPASGETLRCRILDGYLVLAPEGGRKAPDPNRVRTAKVEGSVELTLDSKKSGAADEPEAEEPLVDIAGEVDEMVTSLADENVAVRKAGAQGLWEVARRGETEVLLPYLKHDDPRVRLVIAGVLGEAGAAQCAGALAEIAEDPDATVRETVLYAFAQLGEKAAEHAPAVRKRLSDSESSVKARAVEALAAVSPKSDSVAREILDLTRDDDPTVRQAAAAASYEFVMRDVTGPFIEMLADMSLRSQALELLQQAEGGALRRLLSAARNAPSESGERALETLSYVTSRSWTVDDFRQELNSSEAEIRLTAVEGLAMIGGEEAVKELTDLVNSDPSPEVKSRAAEVLNGWQEVTAEVTGAGADD